MSQTAPLSEPTANAVYDILERECGARASNRLSFVLNFTKPTFEWRFMGALGFGGKIYFSRPLYSKPAMWVSCYREHETPERLAMIKAANDALAALGIGEGDAG